MLTYANPYASLGAKWYRGNLHTHTTESDGWLSPKEVCALYRDSGYDFLAVTDHGKVTDTSHYSAHGFLTIPGTEVGHPDHVLCIGVRSVPRASEMAGLLPEIAGQNGLAIVAHPHWSNMSWPRIAAVSEYTGIEVYAYSPDINRGRGYSVQLWDMLLETGRRVWGFATDDSHHNRERPNACGGWIVAAADALTEDHLLRAIRWGAFYASQGPSFDQILTNEEGIYVHCSPVKTIRFVSQTPGAGWSFHARTGEQLRERSVLWQGQRPCLCPNYVRLEIVDAAGRTAWSNPIWLSDTDEEA